MASSSTQPTATTSSTGSLSKSAVRTGFVVLCALFFFMGFITVLNDILVPKLKGLFNLNYTQSILIQFCFFSAYFFISIPSSGIIRKLGYKRALVLSLVVIAGACLLFLPAADSGVYGIFLGALFLLGSGITLLQVAANPYVTSMGAPEGASFRLVLVQAFNSLATTVGPILGSVLILSQAESEGTGPVKSLYLGIALAVLVVAGILAVIALPKVSAEAASGAKESVFASLQYRHLALGVLGIFCYVGAEVAIGSYMVDYLKQPGVREEGFIQSLWGLFGAGGDILAATAQQFETFAGKLVAIYWGGAMVGRFLGSVVLSRIKPNRVLVFCTSAAATLVALALVFQGSGIAPAALLAVGLFNSIMFPVIFSLAVADLGKLTTNASGLLCTAIVGGAIVPQLQGFLADGIGLSASYILPLLCYLYLVYFGWRGYQVVNRPEQA